MTQSLSGIHCGTYQRVTFELFGLDHRSGWLRIGEFDTMQKVGVAYRENAAHWPNGIAWAERRVNEDRKLGQCSLPRFQGVLSYVEPGEDEAELIKQLWETIEEAKAYCDAALNTTDVHAVWVVDLTTMRTVHRVIKREKVVDGVG